MQGPVLLWITRWRVDRVLVRLRVFYGRIGRLCWRWCCWLNRFFGHVGKAPTMRFGSGWAGTGDAAAEATANTSPPCHRNGRMRLIATAPHRAGSRSAFRACATCSAAVELVPEAASVLMSASGPHEKCNDVRSTVANWGKADVLAIFAIRRE